MVVLWFVLYWSEIFGALWIKSSLYAKWISQSTGEVDDGSSTIDLALQEKLEDFGFICGDTTCVLEEYQNYNYVYDLSFLDFNFNDGMGFTVDLGGNSEAASSISITTANDIPNRDPQNYTISGSNDGSNFTQITTGLIPCVSTRFHQRTYSFSNTTFYKYYRINFG